MGVEPMTSLFAPFLWEEYVPFEIELIGHLTVQH